MSAKVPKVIGIPVGWSDGCLEEPPSTDVFYSNYTKYTEATIPILRVQVCEPQYSSGMELYVLMTAMAEYCKSLGKHGIIMTDTRHVNIACHNISNPTENYTNTFSPNSIAEQASNIGSEVIQDIAFMTGSTKVLGDKSLMEKVSKTEGLFGSAAKNVNNLFKQFQDWADNNSDQSRGNAFKQALGKLANTVNHQGSRIDFPMMWRSSNYTASYSFTTRLYNPFPNKDQAYEDYIVGPLGALLMLALPRSDDGELYQWPYIHNITIPGLLRLPACYVSNLSVSKGGDAVDISALVQGRMRPNLIDVQITFNSLYNVMPFVLTATQTNKYRPTLKSELDALRLKDGAGGHPDTIPTTSESKAPSNESSDGSYNGGPNEVEQEIANELDPNNQQTSEQDEGEESSEESEGGEESGENSDEGGDDSGEGGDESGGNESGEGGNESGGSESGEGGNESGGSESGEGGSDGESGGGGATGGW